MVRRIVKPGVIAGLVGAVAMALLAMIVAAANHKGFFAPMKLIAGTFLGPAVLHAGGSAILIGLVTHLVVGSIFGVLLAAVVAEDVVPGMQFAFSLLYGLGIFILMTIFFLPLIDKTMSTHIDEVWFLIYHLVYGALLALVIRAVRAAGVGEPQHA